MHFSQSPDLTQVIDRQTTCSDSCFGYAAYRHLRKGLEGGYLPETVRPVYLSHLFSETITSVKFVNVQEDDVVRPPPPGPGDDTGLSYCGPFLPGQIDHACLRASDARDNLEVVFPEIIDCTDYYIYVHSFQKSVFLLTKK